MEEAPVLAVGMTGAELKAAIEREARRRNTSAKALVAPLSKDAPQWLRSLAAAQRPKPTTIARVSALFAGQLVESAGHAGHIVSRTLEQLPPRVERDPCSRCGVRADVGCQHRLAFSARSA